MLDELICWLIYTLAFPKPDLELVGQIEKKKKMGVVISGKSYMKKSSQQHYKNLIKILQ